MKRLIIALISAAFILAPMSASALEMMSDQNMKDVTGQAGVSIAIDDVVLFQHIGYTRYTDTDGIGDIVVGGTTSPDAQASVLMTDRTSLQLINAIAPMDTLGTYSGGAITTIGDIAAEFTYNQDVITGGPTGFEDVDISGFTWEASPLTIDVGYAKLVSIAQDLSTPQSVGTADVTGVVIGLPTVEIHTGESTYDVGVVRGDKTAFTDAGDSDRLIRIENGASTTAILGGHVEIAPH